jgi:hypothetical protein
LTWDDVAFFLEELGAARREDGYKRQRFRREGKVVNRVDEDATVLQLGDGKRYVCGDYGESLVFGPDKTITAKLGLNLQPVAEIIRKYAFPEQTCGAAYLRWPDGEKKPSGFALPFGALIFLRQTLRADRNGGWIEQGVALRCFVIQAGQSVELKNGEKKLFLQGLFRSVIRKSPETAEDLLQFMVSAETDLIEQLRRPTEQEMAAQIRHSVMPLFASVITE